MHKDFASFSNYWHKNFTKTVAEFYVTELMAQHESVANGNAKFRKVLRRRDETLKELTEFFRCYIFVSCTGEARHHEKCSSRSKLKKIPAWVMVNMSRSDVYQVAWEIYQKSDRTQLTKKVTQLASLFSESSWEEGMGGQAWGEISAHLLKYLIGIHNDVSFVDGAVYLAHNRFLFVDKIGVNVDFLQEILDVKFSLKSIFNQEALWLSDQAPLLTSGVSPLYYKEMIHWLREEVNAHG